MRGDASRRQETGLEERRLVATLRSADDDHRGERSVAEGSEIGADEPVVADGERLDAVPDHRPLEGDPVDLDAVGVAQQHRGGGRPVLELGRIAEELHRPPEAAGVRHLVRAVDRRGGGDVGTSRSPGPRRWPTTGARPAPRERCLDPHGGVGLRRRRCGWRPARPARASGRHRSSRIWCEFGVSSAATRVDDVGAAAGGPEAAARRLGVGLGAVELGLVGEVGRERATTRRSPPPRGAGSRARRRRRG